MDRLKHLEQEIFKLKETLKTKEKQLCEIKQNSISVNMSKRKSYSKDDLEKALEAIKEGFSVKSTSKKFGIPRATLHFRLSSKFVKSSFGPRPVLSGEDETTLVEWIEHCSNIGFPKSKGDILQSIKEFITINNIKTPFKDNCPGDGWYKAFLRRHPSIAERTSEAVTKASARISEGDVRGWFKQVEVVLEEEQLSQVLQQPERIFIVDESRFLLNTNLKPKVLSKKGSKDVYEIDRGDAKSSLTVLFSFSAVGAVSPPMIIYPYKRIPANIIETVPKEWGIGRSDTGWIKSELFFEYISNVFHPWLIKSNIPLPVILFVDGHKSHLTFHLSELCTEMKITLIALYPNATKILQQADVSAFQPFKNGWKKGLTEWRLQNPEKDFTKIDFAPVLKIVLTNCINKNNLINGFRACGLYPWNPNNIDFIKCLGQSTITVKPEPSSDVLIDVTSPNQLMNFDDFINIIGEDIADNLDKTSESSLDEKGRLLKKIYLFFKSEEGSLNKSSENILSSINLPEGMISPKTVDDVKPSTSFQSTPVKRSLRKRKIFASSSIIKSPLAEVLQWPDSPKKKFKGNIQTHPFVVTSQKRKLMMDANVLEKKKAIEIKESKKLDREKKKINKPKKQAANVETQKPSLCFKCGSTLKSNFLSCSMCSKTFHEKCLKRYDFPESGNSDEFICPVCYTVETINDFSE